MKNKIHQTIKPVVYSWFNRKTQGGRKKLHKQFPPGYSCPLHNSAHWTEVCSWKNSQEITQNELVESLLSYKIPKKPARTGWVGAQEFRLYGSITIRSQVFWIIKSEENGLSAIPDECVTKTPVPSARGGQIYGLASKSNEQQADSTENWFI